MRRLLLAVVLLLGLPASAQASFDVPSVTVTPSGTAAGSHPDVSVALSFSGDEHVRDLTVGLPPGLIGNPNAAAKCATAKFQADACADNTRVGTTTVQSTLLGLPVTANGEVYNVQPGAGEPARLGVIVRPPLGADKVFLTAHVALRKADGGLDSIINGIPSTVRVLGIEQEMSIKSMTLTLLGRPAGAAQPFMTLPTSCGPATTRVTARSASGTSVTRAAAPFTPTACAKLRFKPRFAATISAGRLPSLSTVITGTDGDANAASASVTLPKGIGVNLAAASNTCTVAQQAAGCPAASHVGGAVAQSPLLPTLSGPVSLAEIPGQPFPGIRVDLSGVVSLSLPGVVTFVPELRTTFAGLPDVPLRRFALTFDAGGALRTTRDVCTGPLPRMTAELTGHNGAKATVDEPVTVTGCRKPVASLRVHGRKLVLRVRAARNGPALKRVRLTLPKRLKAHPRRGRVSPGAKLSRRGVLTVKANGARRITATLRHGAFTGRLGAKRRFALRTVDVTGHPERQRIRARR